MHVSESAQRSYCIMWLIADVEAATEKGGLLYIDAFNTEETCVDLIIV